MIRILRQGLEPSEYHAVVIVLGRTIVERVDKERVYLFLLFLFLTTNVYADRFREISDETGKLVIVRTPAYSLQSLAANATTVDVSIAPIVVTGINAAQTDITGFDNAVTGNTIIFVGNKNTVGNLSLIHI